MRADDVAAVLSCIGSVLTRDEIEEDPAIGRDLLGRALETIRSLILDSAKPQSAAPPTPKPDRIQGSEGAVLVVNRDLRVVIAVRPGEYVASFELYAITGTDARDNTDVYDGGWNEHGANVHVSSLAEASAFADGDVKWDGCVNYSFRDQREGAALHACGRENIERRNAVLLRAYDFAAHHIARWDGGDRGGKG